MITKEWLKQTNACADGVRWFLAQSEMSDAEIIRLALIENHFDWANWAISRLLANDDKIRYAIFAAELVLQIYEKQYPEDSRPRAAIDAAREYLRVKSSAAYAAAADAAYAADAAAADADAYAAHAAAAYAAYAAAYAADADAYAAAAYAAYAADADAYAAAYEIKMKIIEFGIGLLEGGRK